jgi:riboflavin kinase/FMN adenylyltransferase
MKVFWTLSEAVMLPDPVVTVGVFDGVHLGHRSLMDEVRRWAEEVGGTSVVLTFSNQPASVIGGREVREITSLRQRISLIGDAGVDCCVVLEFTNLTASMEAENFIDMVIVNGLGCEYIVAGFDWRFGTGRSGGKDLLLRLQEEGRIRVRFKEATEWNGEIVSSTAIRAAVETGELDRAFGMLGRPFSLLGKVVRGSGRGASLGFPTANLDVEGRVRPPDGVYAATALIEKQRFLSVASLGVGPTFGGDPAAVEVHVVGVSEDLYGKTMELELAGFLREQKKFSSEDDLAAQIGRDVEAAKGIIGA